MMRRFLIYTAIAALLLCGGCGTAEQRTESKTALKKDVNPEPEADSESEAAPAPLLPLEDGEAEYTMLEPEEKEGFLEQYGFLDSEPFFTYTHPENDLSLVFYYDEASGLGCGMRIWHGVSGEEICAAFAFRGCEERSWDYPNPYELVSATGDPLSGIENFQVHYEYDGAGRIAEIETSGTSGWYSEYDTRSEWMVKMDYTYDDAGILRKWEYSHNAHFFGTTRQSQRSWYDGRGRLAYTSAYITHGSLEEFYIYGEDSGIPEYCLLLDNQYTAYPSLCRYTPSGAEWEWKELAIGGEDVFIRQLGFGAEEPFCEYEYDDGRNRYGLTLYYRSDTGAGCGCLTLENEGAETSYRTIYGFSFEKTDVVDVGGTDPYTVYAYYTLEGREFPDSRIPLPEYLEDWRLEGFADVICEGDRLMYAYLANSHGCTHWFYLYPDEGEVPYACVELDVGWGVSFYRFE